MSHPAGKKAEGSCAVKFLDILTGGAVWVIPCVTGLAALILLISRRDMFSVFVSGAREGLSTALHLLPSLCAMLCGVGMLRASGALELISRWLAPLLDKVGIPAELTPLLVTRPFSGSASLAVFSDLLAALGPDSFPALCAAVIMGSSDTAVYVLSVYFSSVNIRKTRYALPCALAVMIFCAVFSCLICRFLFK